MRVWWFCLLIGWALLGCSAGSGEGLDANGRPLDEGGSTGPLTADFKSIQDNVFTPICTECHAGAAAPVGLRLDDGNSFSMLVGVASVEVPSLLRVNPGDPDNSYLIQKLEGTAAVGERMPLNGPPLPQADIDVIRAWVTNGAMPPNDPATAGVPPAVQSVTPIDGAVVAELPTEVTIAFDKEIDASTINTNTLRLTASGGDGGFTEGNEVAITPVSVQPSTVNPLVVSMALSGVTGEDDLYEIRVVADGASQIMDIEGLILDGDGDGIEGGDFVSTFTLQQMTSGALEANFASIQDNIFTPICTACHTGSGAPEGLRLDANNSYSDLVNVPSAQVPSLLRVNPGDPNNSYLIQKLEGAAGEGSRMPRGGPFLEQATIDIVRQWISNGALESDGAPTDTNPPIVNILALGSTLAGVVTVVIDAQDDAGVSEVQLFADGTLAGSDTTAPYSVLWDTNTVTDGNHELTATATDSVGNVGTSPVVNASVDNTNPPSDNTPPTITLTVPQSPLTGTVSLSATASDDVGLTEVRFLVGGALLGSDTTDPFDLNWDTTTVADGDYTMSAQALDAVGNVGLSSNVLVTVENNGAALTATFESIQASIFTPICSACHSGANPPAGLPLDAANSYDALFKVDSTQVPDLQRVDPGRSDDSYLIQKLEGTAAVGQRMPLGGPFLEQNVINVIRLWIDEGAERESSVN